MNATVVSQPIIATVSSSGAISASVGSSVSVTSTASGGIGPQGPSGVSSLGESQDVQLSGLSDGDVLRYSNSKWRNYPDSQLCDGGNF